MSGSSTFDSRAETGALASSAAVVLNQPVQQQPVPGKQCNVCHPFLPCLVTSFLVDSSHFQGSFEKKEPQSAGIGCDPRKKTVNGTIDYENGFVLKSIC